MKPKLHLFTSNGYGMVCYCLSLLLGFSAQTAEVVVYGRVTKQGVVRYKVERDKFLTSRIAWGSDDKENFPDLHSLSLLAKSYAATTKGLATNAFINSIQFESSVLVRQESTNECWAIVFEFATKDPVSGGIRISDCIVVMLPDGTIANEK